MLDDKYILKVAEMNEQYGTGATPLKPIDLSADLKVNRAELMKQVYEIIHDRCSDPAAELRAHANAILAIAAALEGADHADAKAVIESVAVLHGVTVSR